MRLRLRIERVVLDGLPLQAADGSQVQAALAAELERRLAEHGVDPGLGGQIARAVGAGLQRESGNGREGGSRSFDVPHARQP